MRDRLESVFSAIADEARPTGEEALGMLKEELSDVELRDDGQWICEFQAIDLDDFLRKRGLDEDVEQYGGESHQLAEGLPDELWLVAFGVQAEGGDDEPDGWALVLLFEAGDGDWVDEHVIEEGTFDDFVEIVTGPEFDDWELVSEQPVLAVHLEPRGTESSPEDEEAEEIDAEQEALDLDLQ